MKKIAIHKVIIVCVLFFLSGNLFAQLDQAGKLLAGGTGDAEKLLQAYLKPLGNSMGAGLSAGWYNTAKVHKLGGFDLTFNLSFAFAPAADKIFNLADQKLSAAASYPAGAQAPTLAGKHDPPQIEYWQTVARTPYKIASYKCPKGLGVGFVPVPMLQLSVGLIKETELQGRFVPTTSIKIAGHNYGSIGLWGIGIKHGLKQWIPVVSRIPFLNLTFQAGYTKLTQSTNISVKPADIGSADQTTNSATNWNGQKMDLKVGNFTANVIVSVDIPVISVYGSVGLSSSKTNLALLGNYPIPTFGSIATPSVVTDQSMLPDPLHIKVGSNDGSLTKPRFNVGLKFKLAVLHIHVDYTYALYSIASAGIGISFR